MPSTEQILWTLLDAGVLPALLAAALVAGVCWLAGRFDPVPYVISAIVVAAGLALGTWLEKDFILRFPPGRPAWEWLGWVSFAALAIGILARLPFVPPGVGWSLWGMASAHAGWLLTPVGLREGHWWIPLVLAGVIFTDWVVLEEVGRLDPRGFVPLLLVPAALTATILVIFISARFGGFALVLTSCLAGVGIGGFITRREGSGVSPAVAVMLPALALLTWYERPIEPETATVPTISFVLAALCPLALAPSLIPAWQRYQRKGLWAVQLLLVLVLLGSALGLAERAGALALPAEAAEEEEW
jgi:hypothetical protein